MGNVRNDRFGNATMLKMAKSVVNKKSGEVLPIYKTFIEIGNALYKVEISHCNKATKDGNPGMWVKFTKEPKRQQNQGFSNGPSNYGGQQGNNQRF
jgi:hypothetical protein